MDGLLNFLAIDDNDADVASLVIQLWLRRKSPLQVWLKEKRRTLQRILRNTRIGMLNFIQQTLPRYPDIQFFENFRMSRTTFQVLTCNVLRYMSHIIINVYLIINRIF